MNTVIATTKKETKINHAQSPKANCHASFSSSVLSVDGLNAPEVRLAVQWSAKVLSTKWNKTYGDRGDELGENWIVICNFVSNKLVCVWLVCEVEE